MKTQTFNVVEIFKSIEGEGKRVGLPAVFIRLFGCNLRCGYCDTVYGIEGNDYKIMTLEEILDTVKQYKCQLITLTGGEPLIHKNVADLIYALTSEGYLVNIETNGAVDIKPYLSNACVLVTLDYKCPSSGMEDKMLMSNFEYVRTTDVVKFVVGSKEDLDKAKDIVLTYGLHNVYFSPVFGKIEPKKIVDYILENNLNDVRVQLQIHKFIWKPDKRGV